VTDTLEREATAPAPSINRGQMLVALTALHMLNDFYGLILPPLLPALKEAFQLSYTQLGLIPFVGTAVSSVLQPTLGYVADRRRQRRLFMLAGFIGYALAMLWLAAAGSYGLILVGAVLLGLASSTYHPQSATFLLHYFSARRGFAQGVHGLGNGLGFLLAPLAAATLVPALGWQAALQILALPALVAAALVWLGLREPPIRGARGFLAGVTGPVALLTVVSGLGLAGSFGFLVWLPSYYAARGYSLGEAGVLTAAMVATGLIAQPAGGALSDRFGRRSVMAWSLMGVALFQTAFVFADSLAPMLALSLLAGFASAVVGPVVMVYAAELAAGGRTGTAVGVVWGLGISFSSLAPPISGWVIDGFGFAPAFVGLSVATLVAAGLATRLPAPGR
jgi:FSR family fosmidomycin resistance protein-like MFS transporter